MSRLPKFLRPKGAIRAQAVVVDLANIRVPVAEELKVVVMDRRQDPFCFEYIDHIKRDIDGLGLRVPVFYLLDTLVTPHEMSKEEEEEFVTRQSNSIFDDGHIWRIGSAHHKADFAICQLVNELGALVISGDRFRDHRREGRIERPNNMLQFAPRRASRNVTHRFVNIGHGDKRAEPTDLLDVPASEAEYWVRWKAHVDIILQWVDPVVAEFAEAELRKFVLPEVDTQAPGVEDAAPMQTSRRRLSSTAMPRRPSDVLSVLCGDYWGLSKFTDQWVKVVGRLFQDADGWTLRDLAGSKGVNLPGMTSSRSLKLVNGGWFACVGVLRRDSEGFFLESPELAAPGRLSDIKSAFAVHYKGHRRPHTPWGPAPWRRTQSADETPVVPAGHQEVQRSENAAAEPSMPDEAVADQGHDNGVHSEVAENETSAHAPEEAYTGAEKMAAPSTAVPVGNPSTEPDLIPAEEEDPVSHPSSGATEGTPHVVARTTDGGPGSGGTEGFRRKTIVLLMVAAVLAVSAVILVVL